jgi:hypothetical protein
MKKFKFKANKRTGVDGIKSTVSNGDRASNATGAVITSCNEIGDPAICDLDAITDLIANIGHLCDLHGLNFEKAIKTAKLNWMMER